MTATLAVGVARNSVFGRETAEFGDQIYIGQSADAFCDRDTDVLENSRTLWSRRRGTSM